MVVRAFSAAKYALWLGGGTDGMPIRSIRMLRGTTGRNRAVSCCGAVVDPVTLACTVSVSVPAHRSGGRTKLSVSVSVARFTWLAGRAMKPLTVWVALAEPLTV